MNLIQSDKNRHDRKERLFTKIRNLPEIIAWSANSNS